MDLTLLAPDLQERVLDLEAIDGVEPIGERALRPVTRAGNWSERRPVRCALGAEVTPLQQRLTATSIKT
jgi:hypothetical protein